MIRIVGLAMLLILAYAAVKTFQAHTKIGKRLLARDKLAKHLSQQEILELIETAFWIGPAEIKAETAASDAGPQSVDIVCKDVTYRVASEPNGDGTAILKVDSIYKLNGLFDLFSIKSLRYLQGENRIRCHIMSLLDSTFMEHPREFYVDIHAAYMARYYAIAVLMAAIMIGGVLNTGLTGFGILCGIIAIVTFIFWAFRDYGKQMVYDKLLDGDPIPEYWDNESLMNLLRDSLRVDTLKRLYFGTHGEVLAETSHGTYKIATTFQNPKLFVSIQGTESGLETYLEADRIRGTIRKIIDSSQAEDLDAKTNSLFLTSGISRVCAKIWRYSIILLIAGLILTRVINTKDIDLPFFSRIDLNISDSDYSADMSDDPQDLTDSADKISESETQPSADPEPADAPEPLPEDSETALPDNNWDLLNTPSSDESEDTQYWGTYQLISSDPYCTAELIIEFISDGALIYLDGNAVYGQNVANVYGELEILDNQHFYYEDPEIGSSLSLTYDPDTRLLEVSEDGSFGGIGVTFAGTYAQTSGSIIP